MSDSGRQVVRHTLTRESPIYNSTGLTGEVQIKSVDSSRDALSTNNLKGNSMINTKNFVTLSAYNKILVIHKMLTLSTNVVYSRLCKELSLAKSKSELVIEGIEIQYSDGNPLIFKQLSTLRSSDNFVEIITQFNRERDLVGDEQLDITDDMFEFSIKCVDDSTDRRFETYQAVGKLWEFRLALENNDSFKQDVVDTIFTKKGE